MDLNKRKRIIGQVYGLPSELADRLVGETDAALVADAKSLAKGLKARATTGRRDLNTLPTGNSPTPGPALTLDEVKGMTLAEVMKRWSEVKKALEAQQKVISRQA